jgi:hypothetical protein
MINVNEKAAYISVNDLNLVFRIWIEERETSQSGLRLEEDTSEI